MNDRPRLQWQYVLLVFTGGAFGTGLRYLLEVTWPTSFGEFPWTTFLINVTGAFLLGFLLMQLARRRSERNRQVRLLLGTGFCGGFTSYSALALETVNLFDQSVTLPVAYPLTSLGVGLIAIALGLALGDRVGRS